MPEMDEGRIVFGRLPVLTTPEEAVLDNIRRRAFEIWAEEGFPAGRALEHWLQAEEEVLGKRGP